MVHGAHLLARELLQWLSWASRGITPRRTVVPCLTSTLSGRILSRSQGRQQTLSSYSSAFEHYQSDWLDSVSLSSCIMNILLDITYSIRK